MFGQNIGSGLTFGKILSGISKSLNIANQAIPIIKEVKPMFNKTKDMFGIIKAFSSSNNQNQNVKQKNNLKANNNINSSNYSSKPVFFQ